MVSQEESLISSGITATIVSAAHGGAHYYFGSAAQLTDPVVGAAGATVFVTTFGISYLGMQGYLPF